MSGRVLLVRAVREETSAGEHAMQKCDRYIAKHRRKVVLVDRGCTLIAESSNVS